MWQGVTCLYQAKDRCDYEAKSAKIEKWPSAKIGIISAEVIAAAVGVLSGGDEHGRAGEVEINGCARAI